MSEPSEPPIDGKAERFHFTPTQKRLLDVLADGEPHSQQELHQCLPDEMGRLSNIVPHLVAIRKVLRQQDQDILCEFRNRRRFYRHVRLLRPRCPSD